MGIQMTIEIDRGFKKLAEVASLVQGDEEKAKRVNEKLVEVKEFLGKEGLLIDNPRKQIKEARDKEGEKKYERYQNHLAAVVQEALQVEGNNFKHSNIRDIVRALKDKIANGSDPRLISTYTDSTLAYHVWHAGIKFSDILPRDHRPYLEMPLTSLVALEDFPKIVPFEGWRQTLKYVSQVFPKDAKAWDVAFILMDFSRDKNKSIPERIKALRYKGR